MSEMICRVSRQPNNLFTLEQVTTSPPDVSRPIAVVESIQQSSDLTFEALTEALRAAFPDIANP